MNIPVFILQRDLPQMFILRFRHLSGNVNLMAPQQTARIVQTLGRVMIS